MMAEAVPELQELSVMPMPLALGLDLVMNRPNRVRFVDLPPEGKGKAQEGKGKAQEGKGKAQEADKRKHPR